MKTARKTAAKRTTKKRPELTTPSEDEVAKTPRKRTAKKTAAMTTEAPSDEVGIVSAQPEEAATTLEDAPAADTSVLTDVAPEEEPAGAAALGNPPEDPGGTRLGTHAQGPEAAARNCA
jgi:hypothetical protein